LAKSERPQEPASKGLPKDDPSVLVGFDSEETSPYQAPAEAPSSEDLPAPLLNFASDLSEEDVEPEELAEPAVEPEPIPISIPIPVPVRSEPAPVNAVRHAEKAGRYGENTVRRAESTVRHAESTVRHADGPGPVSLADLKARGVAISWFEAVALVQGVCTALCELGLEDAPVNLDCIFLTADARVHLATGLSRDAALAIKGVGRALDELSDGELPVPLKLAVSKAVLTPPVFSSIAEFSGALSYFERPNRSQILQSVYERWKNLPAEAVSTPAALEPARPLPRVAPSPPNSGTAAISPFRRDFRRRPFALIASGLFIVLLLGWSIFRSPEIAYSSSTLPREALPAATPTNWDAISRLTRRPAELPMASVPRPRNVAPPQVSSAAANRPAEEGISTIAEVPSEPSRVTPRQESISAVPANAPAVSRQAVSRGTGSNTAVDRPVDDFVYTSTSADVVAPSIVYPKLPQVSANETGVAALELVVDQRGDVELAKAATDPASVAEAFKLTMTLSAAKSWRFRPAMRAGVPVKYRLVVWVRLATV